MTRDIFGQEHPLERYHYAIPDTNIRKEPLVVRDDARLFVYDTKTDTIIFDAFKNLANHLPQGALMVMNNTGVIPARVTLRKDTGKKISGLLLMNEGFDADGALPAIVNRQLFPGRRVFLDAPIGVGQGVDAVGTETDYSFLIMRQDEQKFYLKLEFDVTLLSDLLVKYGTTPTPNYLGDVPMTEQALRERYQTVFARAKRSVAAPTASLHFTDRVFATLDKREIRRAEVTLDVGLGTFQEIEKQNVEGKFLHSEPFYISADTAQQIRDAKKGGASVIAVGTTTVRALESAAAELLGGAHQEMGDAAAANDTAANSGIAGTTDIFIMPPHAFQIPDILITNFHVPRSSLMALVDAFLQSKHAKRGIVALYEIAIREGFQFYSFGDSMLIL